MVQLFTKRNFLVLCIVIGIMISLFSAFFLVCPSLMPKIYRVNPNYSGLGVLVNKTNIFPDRLVIIVSAEPNQLYFHYFFNCMEDGTYNFLFSFPFNITRKISCTPENMLVNATSSYGSAVWLQYYSNGTGWRDISGNFEIGETFKSGSGGSYTFVLPFGFGVHEEVIGSLQSQLNVNFISTSNIELSFNVPSSEYDIIQTFPERKSGWLSMPDLPINWAGASWEFPGRLQQSIIIYCQKPNEIRNNQYLLFLGGVLLSIGIQLSIQGSYDLVKEKFTHNSNDIQDGYLLALSS